MWQLDTDRAPKALALIRKDYPQLFEALMFRAERSEDLRVGFQVSAKSLVAGSVVIEFEGHSIALAPQHFKDGGSRLETPEERLQRVDDFVKLLLPNPPPS
jgi:hypothetical protein